MTQVRREFIVQVALVVIGTSSAIRGLAVGDTALAVSGLFLMFLIVAHLAFGTALGHFYLRIFRRPPGIWMRRILIAVFAIAVITDTTKAIAAATQNDWWAVLFYGVRLPASAVLLFDVWTWQLTTPTIRPSGQTV